MRFITILNATLFVVNLAAGIFFVSLASSQKPPERQPPQPLVSCEEDDTLEQTWVNMSATRPEAGDLARLFSLEATLNEVVGVENGSLEEWLIFEQIPAAAESAVKLKTGDTEFKPTYVNLCFTLNQQDSFTCGVGRGVTPDNPKEGKFAFKTAVNKKVPIKLEYQEHAEFNQLIALHAATWPLAEEGIPAKLELGNGGDIAAALPTGDVMLFAIFKDVNGYRKHVWDLRVSP